MNLTEEEIYEIIGEEVKNFLKELKEQSSQAHLKTGSKHLFADPKKAMEFLRQVQAQGGTIHKNKSGRITGIDSTKGPLKGSFSWQKGWAQPFSHKKRKPGTGEDIDYFDTQSARARSKLNDEAPV